MKTLIQVSFVVDVDSEEEAAEMFGGIGQSVVDAITETLIDKGATSDQVAELEQIFTSFGCTIAFEKKLSAA